MVRARVGGAVGGFEPIDLADHALGIAEDGGTLPEQLVGFVGQAFGVVAIGIAHRDEVGVHVRGA